MGSIQGCDTEGCIGVMKVGTDLQSKTMHLLPCGTNYSGPAPVQHYFKIKECGTNEDGIEMKEAAFRGRRLMGSDLLLPDDYCGFVLKNRTEGKPENGGSVKEESSDKKSFDVWEAESTFRDFTSWNHDTLPSKADHIRSVLEWLPVSAALHEEVTADDVEAIAEKMAVQSGPVSGSKRKL